LQVPIPQDEIQWNHTVKHLTVTKLHRDDNTDFEPYQNPRFSVTGSPYSGSELKADVEERTPDELPVLSSARHSR
jgi:hypothetical protein